MEVLSKQSEELYNEILLSITNFKNENSSIHPYDLSIILLKLRTVNESEYRKVIKKIPSELLSKILPEMPVYVQEEISDYVSTQKLTTITSQMGSDDAAYLIENLCENHDDVAQVILDNIDESDKKVIEQIIAFDSNEAGSYIKAELFSASLDENIGNAIKRLKIEKESGKLKNIFNCHIVDNKNHFIGSVGLEELIIFEHDSQFKDISTDKLKNNVVSQKEDIKNVVDMFTRYNLSSIPVVDDDNQLIGRITSDDIYDVIQDSATDQIYSMAGVNEEKEQEESIATIGKSRALWLSLNLLTAILASIVIGLFDTTIQSLVALAVLMPIVASMGGNAGTQTLTVTVRQMALGDISLEDAKRTINKEVIIALVNGFLFATIIGIISYLWFKIPLLGVVIAISMIINLVSAGFFGAVIPLTLQKLKIDPAIGSTVILTTVTDVVGFFSFLGLATLLLL